MDKENTKSIEDSYRKNKKTADLVKEYDELIEANKQLTEAILQLTAIILEAKNRYEEDLSDH